MRYPGSEIAPFFKRVTPLPKYRLRVETGSGNLIIFDFTTRLRTTRYADLKDPVLFYSVTTDGGQLIFQIADHMPVRVTDGEFLQMLALSKPRY